VIPIDRNLPKSLISGSAEDLGSCQGDGFSLKPRANPSKGFPSTVNSVELVCIKLLTCLQIMLDYLLAICYELPQDIVDAPSLNNEKEKNGALTIEFRNLFKLQHEELVTCPSAFFSQFPSCNNFI
jgi:hypothetical protein